MKFHDGTEATSRDVEATYDKIVFPPHRRDLYRKGAYRAVEAIEAPGSRIRSRFRLKRPGGLLLINLASSL